VHADLAASLPPAPQDIVLISYVLGELAPAVRDAVIDRAWQATAGILVIIEPGTPAGYERVIHARTRLIEHGGFVTAPCPHDAPCPLAGTDWCHFAVRLPRSKEHRAAKGAELGYEDEKFSYIAVSRTPTGRTPARVIRHPRTHPGRIDLRLCTAEGIETATVTKRDKDRFRRARKAAWGDSFAGDEDGGSGDGSRRW
jgi:ribosomal protein RSM22 (predicted rRNA methylase)